MQWNGRQWVGFWSYLSPTLRAWAWSNTWFCMLESRPTREAGTNSWALFGDTVLTAVQASPSSFHKQERSGRSSAALKSKETECGSPSVDGSGFPTNVASIPEEVLYGLMDEINGSSVSAVVHEALCQGQLALPETFRADRPLKLLPRPNDAKALFLLPTYLWEQEHSPAVLWSANTLQLPPWTCPGSVWWRRPGRHCRWRRAEAAELYRRPSELL